MFHVKHFYNMANIVSVTQAYLPTSRGDMPILQIELDAAIENGYSFSYNGTQFGQNRLPIINYNGVDTNFTMDGLSYANMTITYTWEGVTQTFALNPPSPAYVGCYFMALLHGTDDKYRVWIYENAYYANHVTDRVNNTAASFGSCLFNSNGWIDNYTTATDLEKVILKNLEPPETDPYSTAPESTPDGGFGDFDYRSDTIPLPSAPTISVSDSGFVTLYKPSLGQLQALAAYMWSGLFDMATFRKIFADPMDCIISLALIPINPTASGSQELKVGNIGTGLTIDKLSTQFVEVSFNSLNIGLRANNFMDYSPYTKLQIYLPFIGTRSLAIDDIAGKNITLKYIIDIFTGACNASVGVEVTDKDNTQKTTTLYQFTGNVLANVPITANNFASFLQATVGAVSTAVGVATGAGALAGVASAINAAQSMKPDIEKSGNLSSTAGFLGVQKPYLILTYPNLCRPTGRNKVTGTPSFIGLRDDQNNPYPLSEFHGFTQLHRINVQGISCTETERQMILSQLTGEGVILP